MNNDIYLMQDIGICAFVNWNLYTCYWKMKGWLTISFEYERVRLRDLKDEFVF